MSVQSHRSFATYRRDAEPDLNELLNDPTLITLMARDGVDRHSLERLIRSTRSRLGLVHPSAASLFEASLFAECRTI
jgi:hypothetical protein